MRADLEQGQERRVNIKRIRVQGAGGKANLEQEQQRRLNIGG